MGDYSLEPLAKIVDGPNDRKGTGMTIECPNCGVAGGVWFANPLDGGVAVHPTTWQRTGDTIAAISLHPSVKMFNHFHSWVRNGLLCVDSPFECTKKEASMDNEATSAAAPEVKDTEQAPAPPAEGAAPVIPTITPPARPRVTPAEVIALLERIAGVLGGLPHGIVIPIDVGELRDMAKRLRGMVDD